MTECCCKKNSPAKWLVEWTNPYRPEAMVREAMAREVFSDEELQDFILRQLRVARPESNQRLEWAYYNLRSGSIDELRVNMAAAGYYVEKVR